MIIRPKNPVFIFVSLFVPWQYFNTYIEINGKEVVLRRYFCKHNKLKKEMVTFFMDDVKAIGFPVDLNIREQEGKMHGIFGTYSSQEIDFLLSDNTIIALNVRQYTKQQIKDFLTVFPNDIVKGKRLYHTLGM